MKIKYKQNQFKTNLILGIFWLFLGVLYVLTADNTKWVTYGYIVIGLLYLVRVLYELKIHYLTIENGLIYKNFPFSKKIELAKITRIKKTFNEYKLITNSTEMKLNTVLIDEKSLTDLNNILGKLSLPPDKTPFANNA